jgi:chromatin remodeling complex protein RSC6
MGYRKLPDIKIDSHLAFVFGHENETINSTQLMKILWKYINEHELKVKGSAKGLNAKK